MKKREVRRDRTIRAGERARREHLRVIHPSGPVDCVCEFSPWFFAKRGAVSCHCKRNRKGNPKVACSICHGFGYHPSVRERIAGNRASHAWLRAVVSGVAADDVDI